MEYYYYPIYICSIVVIIFNLFTLLLICKMHIKQKSIREGYFKVVFTQIILELLLDIILLTIIILEIFSPENKSKPIYILPTLFIFLYNIDILYNIQTIVRLSKAHITIDTIDAFNNDDDTQGEDLEITKSKSIDLKVYSFKRIHILSFLLSFIHAFLYFYILFKYGDNNKIELNWYYYFLNKDETNLFYLFFFLFNYIFFILSIRYLCLKQEINQIIKLKHYSIYCFIISLIGLMFPIKIILNYIYYESLRNRKEKNIFEDILVYIYSFLFLAYLLANSLFRLNCYYVQFILSKKGKKCCSKFKFGLRILFTRIIVPSPNFIDFNNTFLYHSLSNEKDFYKEKDKRLMTAISSGISSDLNTSASVSFTFK